jgi:hypothetical protein
MVIPCKDGCAKNQCRKAIRACAPRVFVVSWLRPFTCSRCGYCVSSRARSAVDNHPINVNAGAKARRGRGPTARPQPGHQNPRQLLRAERRYHFGRGDQSTTPPPRTSDLSRQSSPNCRCSRVLSSPIDRLNAPGRVTDPSPRAHTEALAFRLAERAMTRWRRGVAAPATARRTRCCRPTARLHKQREQPHELPPVLLSHGAQCHLINVNRFVSCVEPASILAQ